MVFRPSDWSLRPGEIMSHHYRLYKGIKPAVDTSPPFSMYNSPISIHYVPQRRACSADADGRRAGRPQSRPHRELSEFLAGGRMTGSLRLPLPLRSSIHDLVQPKLLKNRNYQPPVHRKAIPSLPPQPSKPPPSRTTQSQPNSKPKPLDGRSIYRSIEIKNLFKDAVFTYIIESGVFTDNVISDAFDMEMEKWIGRLSVSDLENLREEIFEDLGVKSCRMRRRSEGRRNERRLSEKQRSPPLDLSKMSLEEESGTGSKSSDSVSRSASSSASSHSERSSRRSSSSPAHLSQSESSGQPDSDRSEFSSIHD